MQLQACCAGQGKELSESIYQRDLPTLRMREEGADELSSEGCTGRRYAQMGKKLSMTVHVQAKGKAFAP